MLVFVINLTAYSVYHIVKEPIYDQPRWLIVALQHMAYVITRTYLFVSGSRIIITKPWEVQPNRRYILASTHQSWFDPFVITSALGWKRLRPLLPCRFITAPMFLSKWWLRPAMVALGAYPAYPYRNYPYGIDASKKLLEAGDTVVIFPQGKRTVNIEDKPKRGVAELSIIPSTLLIPVYLKMNHRTFLPSYHVYVGSPFDASSLSPEEIMDFIYKLPEAERDKLEP